jgi:hypothetical protein
MERTELVRGTPPSNTRATNPAGISNLAKGTDDQLHKPIHQIQENEGIIWTVLDKSMASDLVYAYTKQTRTPRGILIEFVDIFK